LSHFVGILFALQASQVASVAKTPASASIPAGISTLSAVRAEIPPVLDGRDDDLVWSVAPVISGFKEVRPSEDAEPRQRTAARVAYDARNLYVFVRAYDTAPDSIVRLLSRRDVQTASDQIIVMVDSYHDRRTGYEFAVNPVGVKADYAIYDDGNEDGAWDGVWDAATQIDSLGWTAEYRIPLSQLRYPAGKTRTFGFLIWRSIQRYTSQMSWPLYHQSKTGFVSQFGELTGLTDLATPRRAELTPYVVTKSEPIPDGDRFNRHQGLNLGADLKYSLASNLTLNATINPDFGQVEADPAVLNLSAFETQFQERRPFFVEGRGLFNFDVNCSAVNCSGEGLFYSRRIGREPQLSGQFGDEASARSTTILGAAKITGRLPGGIGIGVLNAVTDHETGPGHATIEPVTNYSVVRLTRDHDGGNGSVGLMVTGVNRSLDKWSRPSLHDDAYVAALDFRQRLLGKRYEIGGSMDLSRVAGSQSAIYQTQTSAVHLYQRPDGNLRVDSSRTSLPGDAEEIRFGKVSGNRLKFQTSYSRRSPGFEINDLGFLLQADQQSWANWAGLRFNNPNQVFQSLNWNFNWWQMWSTAGLATERAANTNAHIQLNSRWWIHAGGTYGQLGRTFCDRCARGGPALRQDPILAPWMGLEGDQRKKLVPFMWINYSRYDGGRSRRINLNPELDYKLSSRFSTSLSLDWTRNRNDSQFFDRFTDSLSGTEHFTFAHLEQTTVGLTWRLDYTFTPTTSLQLYAQPFISKGTFSDVRELSATPRAVAYGDRFQSYADPVVSDNPGGFNVKQFHSNAVFRWEYRPGSTLFVVWSQGRNGRTDAEGGRNYGGDIKDLFSLPSQNTFLVKFSYWLTW
jgi:Domain of unknown function (DUF5916)/Carbohydrate family 9 binding domain-like